MTRAVQAAVLLLLLASACADRSPGRGATRPAATPAALPMSPAEGAGLRLLRPATITAGDGFSARAAPGLYTIAATFYPAAEGESVELGTGVTVTAEVRVEE